MKNIVLCGSMKVKNKILEIKDEFKKRIQCIIARRMYERP